MVNKFAYTTLHNIYFTPGKIYEKTYTTTMDLNYLLNILLKRKWLILSVILISAVSTWFLIGKLPDAYRAASVIETGIINYKGPSLARDNTYMQKFIIESNFSGLIEKMKSRRLVKSLTDQLLTHDLLADGLTTKPFRVPDSDDMELSQSELDDLVMKLKTNLDDSIMNAKPVPYKSNASLAEAYGYDYESLMEKLTITRIGETDYLNVEFQSEHPALSYFVVNTFLDRFFKEYEGALSDGEVRVLKFNQQKLKQVKSELDSLVLVINKYKTENGLVDVTTQRETVIAQKKDLEMKLQDVEQSIPSMQRNLKFLEREIFNYNERTSNDAYDQLRYNTDFVAMDKEITDLQDRIIDARVNGAKNVGTLEKRLEGLKAKRAKTLEKSIAVIPQSEKEVIDDKYKDLVRKQLDLKLDLELAQQSKSSYNKEINKLTSRANKLLVDDNYLYNLVSEKNRLDLEYEKIRNEYEQSEYLAEGTESPLDIIEPVEMPTEPESKNRTVFSVFAGVAGGSLTSIFLFILAFMDTSIATPGRFSRMTNLPLLGFVNKVKLNQVDLQELFSQTQTRNELEYFKENIRKIRTAIENSGAKTFLFVSPKQGEGKSFLVVLLAYALSLNNRKVLIIDTNFKHNSLTELKSKSFIELSTVQASAMSNFRVGQKALPKGMHQEDPYLRNIDIVGNQGGSQSPSEVLAGKDFNKVMNAYKKKYDFIFMESAAMNKYSDARELLPYTEKLAVVFSAESPIGSTDKNTLDYLKGMNGKMFGGILNNVDLKNI